MKFEVWSLKFRLHTSHFIDNMFEVWSLKCEFEVWSLKCEVWNLDFILHTSHFKQSIKHIIYEVLSLNFKLQTSNFTLTQAYYLWSVKYEVWNMKYEVWKSQPVFRSFAINVFWFISQVCSFPSNRHLKSACCKSSNVYI